MARGKKKSPFDQRLKDLEREAAVIRGDIKNLSRVVESTGPVSLPDLKSRRLNRPELAKPAPRKFTPSPAPVESSTNEAPPQDAPPASPLQPTPEVAGKLPVSPLGDKARNLPPEGSFSNYLSSGSFGTRRSLGQERTLQRNKALFMVLVVLVVGFVVIKLAF